MGIYIDQKAFQSCTGARPEFAARYFPFFQQYAEAFQITDNERRTATFLATLSVESNCLADVEEGLYYKDPLRIATIFQRVFDVDGNKKLVTPEEVEKATPYARNPKGLSKILYDGFHGRGLIQLTWKKNYEAYYAYSGQNVVASPDLLLTPEIAMHSAMWFWFTNRCNEASDTGSMTAVTKIVNGPALMHLKERSAAYNQALAILEMINS